MVVVAIVASIVCVCLGGVAFALFEELLSVGSGDGSLSRWFARNPDIELATQAASVIVPVFCGVIPALMIRDVWLRSAIRRRLGSTACAGCGGMAKTDNAEGVKLYQQGNYLGAVNSFQQALAKHGIAPAEN
jgi:hypothetical protein